MPILRAKMRLCLLGDDDTLVVLTDHSCAMKSLPQQIKKMGYQVDVRKVNVGIWEIEIKKNLG